MIVGKLDENGNDLIPGYGELTADVIARILFTRYKEKLNISHSNDKINILNEIDNRVYAQSLSGQQCILFRVSS